MNKLDRRYFPRKLSDLSLELFIQRKDSSSKCISAKALNYGNGGALVETEENLLPYVDLIGSVKISIDLLWHLAGGNVIQAPFRVLRVEKKKRGEQFKYEVALQFLLLQPSYDGLDLKRNITSTLGWITRRAKTTDELLQNTLKLVINLCSAKGGIFFIVDNAATNLSLLSEIISIKNYFEIVASAWECRSSNDVILPIPLTAEATQKGNRQLLNKVMEERLEELKNTQYCIFSMFLDDYFRGLICILSPAENVDVETLRSPIEDSLAEVCLMMEIIVDRSLQEDLLEINRKSLSMQSTSLEVFMCSMLSETRERLGCSGVSFFAKERVSEESQFTLVGTSPKSLPQNRVTYELTENQCTSIVLRSQCKCIVHCLDIKRHQITKLEKTKWVDVPDEEEVESVLFIPVVRREILVGLLRCSNKVSATEHGKKYFNANDLRRAEAFASQLMTLFIAHQKDEEFASTLLDISHEIRTSLSGIKSAATYVENALKAVKSLEQQSEKLFKLGHIKNTVDRLIDLLPVLQKKNSGGIKEDNSQKEKKERKSFIPYAELCKPICEAYREEARKRNITIKYFGEDQLGRIYADIEDYDHIFRNLTVNAIKYTYEGKDIIVKFQRAGNNDEYAMIHILSESLPIRDDEREEIFRPQYRAEAARKSGIGGEGRGLMIARTIARRYSGDVVLNCRNNINVFSILIPSELFR